MNKKLIVKREITEEDWTNDDDWIKSYRTYESLSTDSLEGADGLEGSTDPSDMYGRSPDEDFMEEEEDQGLAEEEEEDEEDEEDEANCRDPLTMCEVDLCHDEPAASSPSVDVADGLLEDQVVGSLV